MIVLPSSQNGLTVVSPHSVISLPSQKTFSFGLNNGLVVFPKSQPTSPSNSYSLPVTRRYFPLPVFNSSSKNSSTSTQYGSVQNSTGSPYIIVQPQNVAEAVSENENIVTPNIEPQIHVSVPQSSQQSLPPQITINEPNPLSLQNPVTWIIIGLLVVLILVIIFEGVR